ncbi:MAG: hypothetical protein JOZ81_28745 [Chloroflexi bacterium]|nr:hypothetical protein [Chloroflexota bacterium]
MTAALSDHPSHPRVISVRPAPVREPPFDDELPARPLTRIGPHDRVLPFAPSRRRLQTVADSFGVRPTGRGDLPDPESFTRRLLVGAFEVLGGRRSLHQLAPHVSARVYAALVTDVERVTTRRKWRTPPAVRSIRVCEPADGVAEVAAVIYSAGRSRAVALRLEGLDGRWRCVRLQIG